MSKSAEINPSLMEAIAFSEGPEPSDQECKIFIEWQENGKHKEIIEQAKRQMNTTGLGRLVAGWGKLGEMSREFFMLSDDYVMAVGLLHSEIAPRTFSYRNILLLLKIFKKRRYHIPHIFDKELEAIGIDTGDHSYLPRKLSKLDFMLQVEAKELLARLLFSIEENAFWATPFAPCKECRSTQEQIKTYGHITYGHIKDI